MRVGYMPETDTLPDNATAADFVAHMAEMSGLPRRAARQRAADVLYQVGLDEERYRLVKGFSTGMKQRVKLAQAIVHDPELVFLDEPTNGLDPLGREEMLDLIGRIQPAARHPGRALPPHPRRCGASLRLRGGARRRACRRIPAAALCRTTMTADLHVRVDGDPGPFLKRLEELGLASRPAGIEYTSDEFIVARNGDRDAGRDPGRRRDNRLAAASVATGEAIAGRPLRRLGWRGEHGARGRRRASKR